MSAPVFPTMQNVLWTSTGRRHVFKGKVCTVQKEEIITAGGVHLMLCRQEGQLYVEDIRNSAVSQRSAGILPMTLPALWDLRGHDYSAYDSASYRYTAIGLSSVPERRGLKRGMLIDSDLAYGMLRMYIGQAAGLQLEDEDNFKVSYDLEELLDWLTDGVG